MRAARDAGGAVRLIAVNNAWEMAPWADALYAGDGDWWRTYRPAFKGLRVTQDPAAASFGAVRVPVDTESAGFSYDPIRLHAGGNSGFQAVNLAVLAGGGPIGLLGFDMKDGPAGRRRWHGDHPAGLANPPNGRYRSWIARFDAAARDAAARGIEIVNCTPGSALTAPPWAPLEEVLARCALRSTATTSRI